MDRGSQSGFRIHAWGADPTFETFDMPTVGDGQVLIQVEACGVGRTVLNGINGQFQDGRARLPRVPGHELVGTVRHVAHNVDPDLIGKRVTPYFYLFCGMCTMCERGRRALCDNPSGRVGFHVDGGYAPWVALDATSLISLPDGLDPVAATVVADAVATPMHVARRASIDRTDRVAIIGAGGGVGMHMLQMVGLIGADVCGMDVTPDKLDIIEQRSGHAVDASDIESIAGQKLFLGGAPTVVIDLVGSAQTLRWALDNLGGGGRVVTMTTFPGQDVGLSAREMVARELMVVGSRYARWSEVEEAAQMVHEGLIEPIIGSTVGPDGLLGLHRDIENNNLIGRGALRWTG